MFIKAVRDRCNITKKALDYYEAKGLISPKVLDNGYRDYSEEDVATVKEISVLRQCGISIPEIKMILSSNNKSAALQKYKYLTDIRTEKLLTIRSCINNLTQDYNVEREFDYLQKHSETVFSIKEQLVLTFPGNYGLFLALHFGRFLNEPIDTKEKRNAYAAIVNYLDCVSLSIDPELQEFMQEIFTVGEKISAAMLEQQTHDRMTELLEDTDNYLERNRAEIAQHIDYKLSDEFKESTAGRLQQKMLEFQKNSGYQEVFIKNLKVLSPEYSSYLGRMEKANDELLKKFPKAKDLYER